MNNFNRVSRRTLVLAVLALFLATTTQAYHTGIGGDSDGEGREGERRHEECNEKMEWEDMEWEDECVGE